MGDRSLEAAQGQLQSVLVTAPYARAVEEKRDEPGRDEREQVEWTIVAWPGLLAAAQQLLGTQVGCPWCDRRGIVVRVFSLDDWREESDP